MGLLLIVYLWVEYADPNTAGIKSLATVRVVYPLENAPVWLERAVIDRLRSLRGRGESYSDVILRLRLRRPLSRYVFFLRASAYALANASS